MQGRKGIILAGGSGTRLHPLTLTVSKQLLPIFDKPMVYYPLSTLMLAGIREILVISTPVDIKLFERLLGDGKDLGISLSYEVQPNPDGLAQAMIIGERFLNGSSSTLILGDNIFYGDKLPQLLLRASQSHEGATIFACAVNDPERYGVVEFEKSGKVISLEEKPSRPRSGFVATGLYFYDAEAPYIAKNLKPSNRGELEITDLNKVYLSNGSLFAQTLGRGFVWLDAGTHESLLEASQFIATIEHRSGIKISCLEEIAWRLGWISDSMLEKHANRFEKNGYGNYLKKILLEK
jgi:glucose-1-phosphate thymidylyltransferase